MAYNWTYKRIGDVCTVERGGSPRPIDTFITDSNDGINWIKIGDADDSMYITKTEQKIKPEGMKKSKVVVQRALNEAQILFDSLMQQYFS